MGEDSTRTPTGETDTTKGTVPASAKARATTSSSPGGGERKERTSPARSRDFDPERLGAEGLHDFLDPRARDAEFNEESVVLIHEPAHLGPVRFEERPDPPFGEGSDLLEGGVIAGAYLAAYGADHRARLLRDAGVRHDVEYNNYFPPPEGEGVPGDARHWRQTRPWVKVPTQEEPVRHRRQQNSR